MVEPNGRRRHLHLTCSRCSYAAERLVERSSRAISSVEAPTTKSARNKRSSVAPRAPASSFATRDWLDPSLSARSCWVQRRRIRWRLRLSPSVSFIATIFASSGERSRNSSGVPTFHPVLSSLFFFAVFMALTPQVRCSASSSLSKRSEPTLAAAQNLLWRRIGLLRKYIQHDDRINLNGVDDPAAHILIDDPKLMTAGADRRHGPGIGSESLSPL